MLATLKIVMLPGDCCLPAVSFAGLHISRASIALTSGRLGEGVAGQYKVVAASTRLKAALCVKSPSGVKESCRMLIPLPSLSSQRACSVAWSTRGAITGQNVPKSVIPDVALAGSARTSGGSWRFCGPFWPSFPRSSGRSSDEHCGPLTHFPKQSPALLCLLEANVPIVCLLLA